MDSSGEISHAIYHKDGSVWARGFMCDGQMSGHWEWFRIDGTLMRSGHFVNGEQSGEWITFDKTGAPYKTTIMKPKAARGVKQKRAF